ncbi:hypothetical protein SEUCBS139899_001270 [Sporothrix eucalyptigena]
MDDPVYDLYGYTTNNGEEIQEQTGPRDPKSFAVFVVANVGGRYRQLAVVRYGLPSQQPDTFLRGTDAVCLCLRVVLVFSHPANRIAIEGELALAADAYTRGGLSPPVVVLEKDFMGNIGYSHRSRSWSPVPWPPAPWLREFPFIGLALQLAATYEQALHKFNSCMYAEPLGLVYDNDNGKYGIGIIDISDLDTIRYGIIAAAHEMVYIERIEQRAVLTYDYVTETPTRTPLSAQEYMAKFDYKKNHPFDCDAISLLEARPLITPEALSVRPLGDLVATRLIEDLLGITSEESVPMFPDNIAFLQSAAGAQAALRRELLRRASELHRSRHAAHLLVCAFGGQTHLPWAAFAGLPVAVLQEALQNPALCQAQSINLCIDTIQGTAEQIIEALSTATTTFRYLCFHQEPQRTDDDITTELYAHLAASSLLHEGVRLTMTGTCSAALRYRMWLPTSNSVRLASPAFHAFPVQHLFFRSQVGARAVTGSSDNKAFLPCYLHLADTLLPPEAFAESFLIFLSGLASGGVDDEQLPFLFAHSASSLAEIAVGLEPAQVITRGFAVALPAAENLAVPTFPFQDGSLIDDTNYDSNDNNGDNPAVMERVAAWKRKQQRIQQLATIECWPLVRDPVPGSWTVVMSMEKHDKNSALRVDDDNGYYEDLVVRYAFLRTGDDGQVDVVGDLLAFLNETAPEIDGSAMKVEQRLAALDKQIQEKWKSSSSSQPMPDRRIIDMDRNEAIGLLAAFREDARTYGQEALRTVMQEGKT